MILLLWILLGIQISALPNLVKNKSKLCFTKDCITTAATLIKNMDTTVNPCDNFYDYVCGRLSDYTLVDADKIMVTTETLKYKRYLAELRSLLDTPKKFSEPDAVWKAKDFFFACMNETDNKDDSVLKYVEDSLGGFPIQMGDMWEANNFNWLNMATYLHRNGFQNFGIFAFWQNIFYSKHENGKYQLVVGAGKAAISQMFPNIFLNRRYSDAHPNITTVIVNLLRRLSPKDEKNLTAEVRKVVEFAVAIENGPDGESLLLPLSELKRIIPKVNWNTILERVFNRKLDNATAILIKDFHRLKRIVKFATITDKRTVANYIILNLWFSLYQQQELTQSLTLKIKLSLFKETGAEVESRSQLVTSCVQHAGYLSGVIESVYFKKYLTADVQYTVLKMENTIRDQFIKSIENDVAVGNTDWSDIIKMLKVNISVVTDIGATDDILDDLYLDQVYSELPSHRTDHFVNILGRKRFSQLLNFRRYETPQKAIEKLRLIRILRENRVTYVGSVETGIVYIGISPLLLRGIMFSENRDPSLNFGSLGIKIMEGLLVYLGSNVGFASMQRQIIDRFQEMRRCMAKQFDVNNNFYPEAKYAIRSNTDKSILSTQMAEELISVRTAYDAFQKWVQIQHQSSHQLLPAIDANRNQLFWISYATLNCDVYDEEALMYSADTPEFPHKIKVLNVIRNSPEFARDFQCPLNAYMSNDYRCKLFYES